MANIEPEINDFLSAVLGEEVRGSMVSLARKLNTEVEAGSTTINQYTASITQAISDATSAASDANSAAGEANSAASSANAARTSIEANEGARQSAETARQSAETARQSAEQARLTAEQGRLAAEQGRAAAETSRAGAESDRASAEAQRAAAEQGRSSAEAIRVSGEAERVGNEAARVANENLRIAQERDRVNAETDRQRAFNNMSQQVLPVTSSTTLGGMIVGDGLTNDADGRVSVVGAGDLETATHAAATYATKDELGGKANASHTHAASDITSGTLPIVRGGTGLAASPSMLVNLDSTSADDVLKSDPRPGVTGTLPIERGGTGAVTAAGAAENIVDAQAIEPASVTATGEVSGKSGTTTHKLTEKAEDSDRAKLEASIAYVEAVTAKKNHAVGDYFMLGNVLMRATAAIAAGETINASKATPATVQGQIDTLRDSVSGSLTSQSVSLQSGFELRGGSYVKRHGVVSINLGITVKATVERNAQVDLGTITSGDIRPISSVEVLSRPFATSSDTITSITIGSDGTLTARAIFADIPAGSFFWIRTSYFTSV